MSGQGYVTAVVIPEGARSVIVQEEKPCASFLGTFDFSFFDIC